MSLKVACVYKTGGVYTPEYVRRLKAGVEKHLNWPFEWVCLSDDYSVATHALHEGLPGWWSESLSRLTFNQEAPMRWASVRAGTCCPSSRTLPATNPAAAAGRLAYPASVVESVLRVRR